MSKRELHWKPIEDAPNGQEVLIWTKRGHSLKGVVRHNVGGNKGAYEVVDMDEAIIFHATHYALVEGP